MADMADMADMANVDANTMEKQLLELLTHAQGVVTLLQKEAEKTKPKPTAENVQIPTAESVNPVSAVPELEVVNNNPEDKSTSLGRNIDPNFNGAITTVKSINPPGSTTTNYYDFSKP
jgi:hypothetical protein